MDIAEILILLATLNGLAWVWLLTLHGGYWHAGPYLPDMPDADTRDTGSPAPDVVTIIPARDEAEVIGETIASHAASTYGGAHPIILVDDSSTDGTADIARAAAGDARLSIVTAPPLAPGWTGKVHAMHAGLAAAPDSRYVLFTDADIVHAPDTLDRLVRMAEAGEYAMVSLMARLDARGPWASWLIPAFIYFFKKLYPFRWVNDANNRMAGAAGGCMLVRRDALDASGGPDASNGLAAIKDALIDDCALARQIKRVPERRAIWLGLARNEVVSRRDNRRLDSIWSMVARTAYTQLDHSPLLLAGTVLGMLFIYVLPLLLGPLGIPAALLMAISFVPTLRAYGQSAWLSILLPLAALLYTGMTVDSARRHWMNRGGAWKGRVYAKG